MWIFHCGDEINGKNSSIIELPQDRIDVLTTTGCLCMCVCLCLVTSARDQPMRALLYAGHGAKKVSRHLAWQRQWELPGGFWRHAGILEGGESRKPVTRQSGCCSHVSLEFIINVFLGFWWELTRFCFVNLGKGLSTSIFYDFISRM